MFNLGKITGKRRSGTARAMRRNSFWLTAVLFFAVQARAERDGKPDGAAGAPETAVAKAADKESDHALIQQLLAHIEELEGRISELETKSPESAPAVTPVALSNPAAVPAPPASPPIATPEPRASGESSDEAGIHLMLLGDLGFTASDLRHDTTTFYLGSLDLFMTGKLSERVSILSEVLFTSNRDNSIGLDVERMYVKYRQNDYFQLLAGRFHSAIGYYNTAYNRGAWFQTTIGRPFLYEFDDNGGFLPLQELGASLSGALPLERMRLNYTLEVGNGRTHIFGFEPTQNNQSLKDGKSINFAMTTRPKNLPGWQAGFSITHDNLSTFNNIGHPELIVTGHVIYRGPKYEFLNEALMLQHKNSISGAPATYRTPGFYSQFSRQFGKYRPYFRYSYLNAQNDEPILAYAPNTADGTLVGRRNGPSVGIRWDFVDHAAVKLQYDRLAQRNPGVNESHNELATELSFAF